MYDKRKQTAQTQEQGEYQSGERLLINENETVENNKNQRKMQDDKSGGTAGQFKQFPLLPESGIDLMSYQ